MYSNEIKDRVEELFHELGQKAYAMINNPLGFKEASNRIAEMISSEITARSKGIMMDMYSELSEKTLNSEEFKDVDRKNAFYEMNIRKKIFDNCQFSISSIDAFDSGMDFKEINRVCVSTATAAGTAAVGSVLKYAMSEKANIPVAVIIAGAVLAFGGMYFKAVPSMNEKKFVQELNSLLETIKKEFIAWLGEIENYFNNCVDSLKEGF